MRERDLSPRELNRALLARQLLLERSSLSITRAVERLAGLQTQYSPSGYVSLWSRLHGFHRESLTRALVQRRVVQATLMRVTIHMVSARDYPMFSAGLRKARRDWWLRVEGNRLEDLDVEAAAASLRGHLAGGPRRATELKRLLVSEGFPHQAWSGSRLWLDLVRVPPSGTWDRPSADLYALAEYWLGSSVVPMATGVEHLVRRYLKAFGPAPLRDVASWAGLSITTVRPVAERMTLRRFRDQDGGELLDVPGAPLPSADVPAPVRFLANWDASLLASARRAQILPEAYRPMVFDTQTPQSVSTFIVDGAVAGKWKYEDGRLRLDPFAPIPRVARRELDAEAARLAAFHAS